MDVMIKVTDGHITYTKEFRLSKFKNVLFAKGVTLELVEGVKLRITDVEYSLPQDVATLTLESFFGLCPKTQSLFDKQDWLRTPEYQYNK
jgi:hypothetical protein